MAIWGPDQGMSGQWEPVVVLQKGRTRRKVSRQMCLESGDRLREESDGLCTVILQERRLEWAEDGTWQQEEEKK